MRTTVLVPELVVAGSAVALLLGARLLPRRRWIWLRLAALVTAVAALGLELWLGASVGTLFGGGWQQDRFALFAKAALLLGLVVLVAGDLEADDPETSWSGLPLSFLVAFGGLVAASATSLVGLWAGLELAALAAVAAAGGTARDIGTRLLLVSAVAGALVAVGFAVLFAMAGGVSLTTLSSALRPGSLSIPLAFVVLLTLTGIVVRLGLAPLQLIRRDGGPSVGAVGAGALGGLLTGVAAVVAARLLGGLDPINLAWGAVAVRARRAGDRARRPAGGDRGVRARAGRLAHRVADRVAGGRPGHARPPGLGRGAARARRPPAGRRGGARAGRGRRPRRPARRTPPDAAGARGRPLDPAAVARGRAPAGRVHRPVRGRRGADPLEPGVGARDRAARIAAGAVRRGAGAAADVPRAGPDPVRGARGRTRPSWSPVPLAPAVLVLLYTILANPISGLALQGRPRSSCRDDPGLDRSTGERLAPLSGPSRPRG